MVRMVLVACIALVLAAPGTSLALAELGATWGLTSFEDDLDGVETGGGFGVEATVGGGAARLMFAAQSSGHDAGDYASWGVGPAWVLDLGGFDSRIFALLSGHSFEHEGGSAIDGWGLTLGGGVSWALAPAVAVGLEGRVAQWEGDGVDARTGSLALVLRAGF